MIYQTPAIDERELAAIAAVERLRAELRDRVAGPRRWVGSLRRLQYARAVQGSNSIEGYDAALDDVMAAIDGDETLDAEAETVQALQGYRDAMTYVLQLADEDDLIVDESLVKALHFMMLKYDLRKSPGRWRRGPVWVQQEHDSAVVYEGPPADQVQVLVTEMLDALNGDQQSNVMVRAAMAHLNLVMVHPFRDGNGRMARCLQTLVLTREKILAPVFSSIEEYLGRNTPAYYSVLAEVGQGAWKPQNSSRPWVRFCLTAHYRQAQTLLHRVRESEELWDRCALLARRYRLPERSVGVMFDAARGLRIRNATYRATVRESEGEDVSEQVASRDLRLLVDAAMLAAQGETRGRFYTATVDLRAVWNEIRSRRPERSLGQDLFSGQATLPFGS
jgi:Fic family protein